MCPQLGAANTAYARSVFPGTLQPGALPDPGLIFDSIFARNKYKQHPNNVSSVMFLWASIIIHGEALSLFRILKKPSHILSRSIPNEP